MTVSAARRVLLSFQKRDDNADARGNPGPFAPEFSRYARLTPLRGGEEVRAQRMGGAQPYIVNLISDSETREITTAWRATDGTRFFNLTAISNPDERRKEIEIMAIEGTAV